MAQVTAYSCGGKGPFQKLKFRAVVRGSDGNFGVGFGATPESAVHKAEKDLKQGGRNPSNVKGVELNEVSASLDIPFD